MPESSSASRPVLGRRAFLQNGTLVLIAASTGPGSLYADETPPVLQIGLVTDLHYADKPPGGTRCYRETPDKLAEAAEQFSRADPAFVVELGDFIDAADSIDTERRYLRRIQRDFAAICADRHYVLGNHCVDTLTKSEFLDEVGQESSWYSFDAAGFHFVVLDSCYRSDGQPYGRKNFEWTDSNIPPAELEWLRSDLQSTTEPVIVFAHQRLDPTRHHTVKNASDVRRILEESGRVLAVFQGHSHRNEHHHLGGIHYCTLVAMVEGSGPASNGYSLLSLYSDQTVRVTGFRRQDHYTWRS